MPIAVWRDGEGGVAALEDRCPHRGAPLSLGEVRDGAIACPYHGWRFGGDGACVAMPALAGECLPIRGRAFASAEADGLIFVRVGKEGSASPDFAPLMHGARGARIMSGEVSTTLADLAENILDTTHTGVVHRGYLRRRTGRRISPQVVAGADWIEARYPPLATPSGFVGRLIGGARYTIVDRFRAPGQAEVEYWSGERLAFAIRFHLSPKSPDRVAAFARMAVAPSWMDGLQRSALALVLSRIFAQDRVILAAVSGNRIGAPRPPVLGPQDLLRPGIEAILGGNAPSAPSTLPDLWV